MEQTMMSGISRSGLSCISPRKRSIAEAVAQVGDRFVSLNRIIVFGSAVTERCHEGSDIDICLDVSAEDGAQIFEMQKAIGNLCDWNCDILMYQRLGARLKQTIQREGVVIYKHPAQ